MKDMTKGSPLRIILFFTIPLICGNIFQQLYNIVDSKIVSHYVGTGAFAAVGMTAVVTNMLIGFVSGFTQGFAILIANSYGAKDFTRMREYLAGSAKLVFCLMVVLMTIGLVFIEPVLRILNTPEDIMAEALVYVRIILLGMPFVSVYNECANVLRAVGDSKTPLYCLILSVVLNVGLDLLLVAGFRLGIAGAAVATIAAQFCCALACFCYIRFKFQELIPHGVEWHPTRHQYAGLFTTGLSMGLMGCLVNIGTIILQSGINGLGTEIIAAHTAARRVLDMLMILIFTYGFTMTTYVSQNLGAGEYQRIRQGVRTSIAIVTVISTVLVVIGYLFTEPVITWLASTDNAAIVSPAVTYCKFSVLFFYVLGPLFILRCSLQGMGRKIIPLASSVLELCIKILSVGLLVPRFGYWGVTLTEPISWCAMTSLLAIGYLIISPRVLGKTSR